MNTNWNKNKVELGEVKEGKDVTFTLKQIEPKGIEIIKPSCSCIKFKYNEKTGVLTCTMSVGNIPFHLRGNDGVVIIKTLLTTYDDDTVDVVEIVGKIVK